jgi:protein-tyrosine-phosphatase
MQLLTEESILTRIVFICSANRCRSPMAQGILDAQWKSSGKTNLIVSSMGVHGMNLQPPTEYAVQVCKEHDIDISSIQSRPIIPEELKAADIILTMEPFQKEYVRIFFPSMQNQVFMLGAYPAFEHSKKHIINDPVGGSIKDYRKSFDEIAAHINRIIPVIPIVN